MDLCPAHQSSRAQRVACKPNNRACDSVKPAGTTDNRLIIDARKSAEMMMRQSTIRRNYLMFTRFVLVAAVALFLTPAIALKAQEHPEHPKKDSKEHPEDAKKTKADISAGIKN